MSIQSFILQKKIKKAQKHDGGMVYFDWEEMVVRTLGEAGKEAEDISIPLSESADSILSTLSDLQEKGLIEYIVEDCYRLTHSGYHYLQTLAAKVIAFLFKSILVPVVVAFLTAVITMLITG